MVLCNEVFAALRVVARKNRLSVKTSAAFRAAAEAAHDLRADVAAGLAVSFSSTAAEGEFDVKMGHLRRGMRLKQALQHDVGHAHSFSKMVHSAATSGRFSPGAVAGIRALKRSRDVAWHGAFKRLSSPPPTVAATAADDPWCTGPDPWSQQKQVQVPMVTAVQKVRPRPVF